MKSSDLFRRLNNVDEFDVMVALFAMIIGPSQLYIRFLFREIGQYSNAVVSKSLVLSVHGNGGDFLTVLARSFFLS